LCRGSAIRCCNPPSIGRSSKPSLSVSSRPAGYTPGTGTKSFSVARPGSPENWQITP